MKETKLTLYAIAGCLAITTLVSTMYTVEEGHVGIVKRFSEAVHQENPGLHFKVPFVDSVEEMDIRTRKNEEEMASSSKEQMPLTAKVSVNWTVDKSIALDLYRKYGSLAQFENRILDPRFRSATKDVLPKFTAEQLIQDRAGAISLIEDGLRGELEGFPLSIDNVQIENIILPDKYIQSIQTKQTEKNLAAAEEHKLERQRLTALQQVNTADAKAQGIEKVAQAEANAIKMKGMAEAESIEARSKALKNNPLLVELTKAQSWDGKLPTTMFGGGDGVIPMLDMREANYTRH